MVAHGALWHAWHGRFPFTMIMIVIIISIIISTSIPQYFKYLA